MTKTLFFIIVIIALTNNLEAQIVDGSAYLLGDYIEIGINPNGYEGAEGSLDEDHARWEIGDDSRLGIVANPQMDGWSDYNGDYFLPGTPQIAFGLQIDGENYTNSNVGGSSAIDGEIVEYTATDEFITLEWEGDVEGVVINMKYKLIRDALYYTTEITLTNTNLTALTNVYFLKTIEPDNNFELIGPPEGYNTTNSIITQSGLFCNVALVTAEQSVPWDSYIGLLGVGNNFRCARGGFFVSSGSDVWNGTGALSTLVGVDVEVDQAISMAYKIATFDAGESETFTYATVFNEETVETALSNPYEITYDEGEGVGTGESNSLIDTVRLIGCEGINEVTLSVEGPNVDSYEWGWSPAIGLDGISGESVVASPSETTTYTVSGTYIFGGCSEYNVTRSIVIIPDVDGPLINITDPGPQCDEFDLTTLTYTDVTDIPETVIQFLTEIPDSATQVSPLFDGDILMPNDTVYLMIADTLEGCFDWEEVSIDFALSVNAGQDSSFTICSFPDSTISINSLVDADADMGGYLAEITDSDQFDAETGELDITGLEGTYTFEYSLLAMEPCANDTATLTVIINPTPEVTISDDVTIASGETTTLSGGGGGIYSWIPITALSTPFSSETEASPTETTIYTLTVTDENGCIDSKTVTVTVDGQVGIEEGSKREVLIYPNPFDDLTVLNFGEELIENHSIIIYNAIGEEVYRNEKVTGKSLEIKKSELGIGLFVLSFFNADSVELFQIKLIVQ